jgi:RNA polymerase sigma factor for flagellar operon FliA
MTYTRLAEDRRVVSDDFVEQHLVLVKRIAHHLAARLPASVELDDLMQAGLMGLIEAAGNFDASRGASFDTYAGIRIRGAMLDEVRKSDWTPRSVHQRHRQIVEAIQRVEAATGAAAEDADVARELGISLNDYHEVLRDAASCRLFSLEQPFTTLQEPLEVPAEGEPGPEERAQTTEMRGRLADAIRGLPEREQLVLSLYYHQELNLKEIGTVLDVTESRVSQIHSQALLRLRARLQEEAG